MKHMKFFMAQSAFSSWFVRQQPVIWYLSLVLGSMLIFFALISYVYVPLMKSIACKQEYYSTLRAAHTGADEKKLRELSKKINKAERALQSYRSIHLPDQLFPLMQSHEVALVSYQHQASDASEHAVLHTLKIKGSYPHIYAWLEELELLNAALKITSWTLKARESAYELELALEECKK